MMTKKGFIQMFSVGGVGSGGFSHSLDVSVVRSAPAMNDDVYYNALLITTNKINLKMVGAPCMQIRIYKFTKMDAS